MQALIIILVIISLTLFITAFHLYQTRVAYANLLNSLKQSLQFEAIVLYNKDSEDPVFEFVPDVYKDIVGQVRNPHDKERHWDYWHFFKDSRKDWSEIIQRIVKNEETIVRNGEVIYYPNNTKVTLDWVCGPRYGRSFLGKKKVIGFYITHRVSTAEPSPEITQQMKDMQKTIEAMRTKQNQEVAREAAKRLFDRYAVVSN